MRSALVTRLAVVWMGVIACGESGGSGDGDGGEPSGGGSSGASGTSTGSGGSSAGTPSRGGSPSGGGTGGSSGAGRGGASGSATGGSSGAATGGSAGAPDDWASVCERYVDVMCPKYEECSPFAYEVTLTPDCPSYLGSRCNDLGRLSDVSITPADYAACVEALAEQSCDDWIYNGITPAECEGPNGTRPPGSSCGHGLQCESGTCSATGPSCGVCSETPPGANESCLEVLCATGFICNQEFVCVEAGHLGEPCSAESPCLESMTCEGGTCAHPPGEDEPCGSPGPAACDVNLGLMCNATRVCEKIPIPAIGEPCTSFCEAGAECVEGDGETVCAESRLEGESCSTAQEACDQWLTCTEGECVAFDPTTCN